MGVAPSFGSWLKQRRQSLGLTQEALADQIGCAAESLRKLEADVRRPSVDIARRLADALLLAPAERDAFVQWARTPAGADRPAAPPATPYLAPLPSAQPPTNVRLPLTPLLGRAAEVAQVCALLHQPRVRLLTLTGAGGIGKTRVSLAVGQAVLRDFPDGVWVVDLAPLRDAAHVVPTIARTLDLSDTTAASLDRFVRAKHLLLILDNLEHLLDAAPRIANLLTAAPGLRVLATSRSALQLSGEYVVALAPLAVPDRSCTSLAEVEQYAAAALFVERVRAVHPARAVGDEDAMAVAAICRRLDGLPLALELAAARSRVLTPPALLARLSSPLALLSGGVRDLPARQQTLRATIAWSYALLPPATQQVFARVAVFVGGWTLEAAEVIAAGDAGPLAVLEQLQLLVTWSMVLTHATPEPRFTLLETVREYAWEQLQASGQASATRQRHLDYFLRLAEAAAPELRGPTQQQYLDQLELEQPNLRAALAWTLAQGDASAALRLSTALWQFWDIRGDVAEGEQWLTQALEAGVQAPVQLRAAALHGAGWLAYHRHDDERAATLHGEALALRRQVQDRQGIADSLRSLAGAISDRQEAERLTEEALRVYRQLDDQAGIARALLNLGVGAHARGDNVRAVARYEAALAVFGGLGDTWGRAMVLHHLAWACYEQGHVERANALAQESLALQRPLRDPQRLAETLVLVGHLAHAGGSLERAEACFAELRRVVAQDADIAEHTEWYLLGDLAATRGDSAEAQTYYEQSLVRARRQGNARALGDVLRRMGTLAHARGEDARAEVLYGESLAHYRAAEDRLGQTFVLFELAVLRIDQGQARWGLQLYHAAQQVLAERGAGLGLERARYESQAAAAYAQLDAASAASAAADGQAMTLDQALAAAWGD